MCARRLNPMNNTPNIDQLLLLPSSGPLMLSYTIFDTGLYTPQRFSHNRQYVESIFTQKTLRSVRSVVMFAVWDKLDTYCDIKYN